MSFYKINNYFKLPEFLPPEVEPLKDRIIPLALASIDENIEESCCLAQTYRFCVLNSEEYQLLTLETGLFGPFHVKVEKIEVTRCTTQDLQRYEHLTPTLDDPAKPLRLHFNAFEKNRLRGWILFIQNTLKLNDHERVELIRKYQLGHVLNLCAQHLIDNKDSHLAEQVVNLAIELTSSLIDYSFFRTPKWQEWENCLENSKFTPPRQIKETMNTLPPYLRRTNALTFAKDLVLNQLWVAPGGRMWESHGHNSFVWDQVKEAWQNALPDQNFSFCKAYPSKITLKMLARSLSHYLEFCNVHHLQIPKFLNANSVRGKFNWQLEGLLSHRKTEDRVAILDALRLHFPIVLPEENWIQLYALMEKPTVSQEDIGDIIFSHRATQEALRAMSICTITYGEIKIVLESCRNLSFLSPEEKNRLPKTLADRLQFATLLQNNDQEQIELCEKCQQMWPACEALYSAIRESGLNLPLLEKLNIEPPIRFSIVKPDRAIDESIISLAMDNIRSKRPLYCDHSFCLLNGEEYQLLTLTVYGKASNCAEVRNIELQSYNPTLRESTSLDGKEKFIAHVKQFPLIRISTRLEDPNPLLNSYFNESHDNPSRVLGWIAFIEKVMERDDKVFLIRKYQLGKVLSTCLLMNGPEEKLKKMSCDLISCMVHHYLYKTKKLEDARADLQMCSEEKTDQYKNAYANLPYYIKQNISTAIFAKDKVKNQLALVHSGRIWEMHDTQLSSWDTVKTEWKSVLPEENLYFCDPEEPKITIDILSQVISIYVDYTRIHQEKDIARSFKDFTKTTSEFAYYLEYLLKKRMTVESRIFILKELRFYFPAALTDAQWEQIYQLMDQPLITRDDLFPYVVSGEITREGLIARSLCRVSCGEMKIALDYSRQLGTLSLAEREQLPPTLRERLEFAAIYALKDHKEELTEIPVCEKCREMWPALEALYWAVRESGLDLKQIEIHK